MPVPFLCICVHVSKSWDLNWVALSQWYSECSLDQQHPHPKELTRYTNSWVPLKSYWVTNCGIYCVGPLRQLELAIIRKRREDRNHCIAGSSPYFRLLVNCSINDCWQIAVSVDGWNERMHSSPSLPLWGTKDTSASPKCSRLSWWW